MCQHALSIPGMTGYVKYLFASSTSTSTRGFNMFAITVAIVFALTLLTTQAMQAQAFRVLHNFTGGADGANPYAGVTVGPSGVLYGTASRGGAYYNGTVFKLSRVNSSWIFSPLYPFTGNYDGGVPYGGVVIGPNGALYGTTFYGGALNYGVMFELRPSATFCRSVLCYWNETILQTFGQFQVDGEYPQYVNLAFDQAGNIYGTTLSGGLYDFGTMFELGSGGETIYAFGSGGGGVYPPAGVVLDTTGNVYGTTNSGVYQLMPSDGGWVENVLVNFNGANGDYPQDSLIIDDSGNLYGTTVLGGQNGDGVVFRLAPSGGGFTYSVLYSFSACEPHGGVAMDAAGNLFGVCQTGGANGDGWIFELTNCGETCGVVDLHDFSGSDGSGPLGAPVLDANGNLYGTTLSGGTVTCGCGVVWEIPGVGAVHSTETPGSAAEQPKAQ